MELNEEQIINRAFEAGYNVYPPHTAQQENDWREYNRLYDEIYITETNRSPANIKKFKKIEQIVGLESSALRSYSKSTYGSLIGLNDKALKGVVAQSDTVINNSKSTNYKKQASIVMKSVANDIMANRKGGK